jgi:hypothetical protein
LNCDITSQFLGVYFKAWKGDFSQVWEKISGWSPRFNWESAPSAGFSSVPHPLLWNLILVAFDILQLCMIVLLCDLVLLQTSLVLLLNMQIFFLTAILCPCIKDAILYSYNHPLSFLLVHPNIFLSTIWTTRYSFSHCLMV